MQNTITIQKIYDLVEEYEEALLAEYKAQTELLRAKQITKDTTATELAKAYVDGDVAGRNADERKRAEDGFVAANTKIRNAIGNEEAAGFVANDATAHREKLYQIISMTKAWLYSQSGRDPYQ